MKNIRNNTKRVIAYILILMFTLSSISMLTINSSAGYSYRHTEQEDFYFYDYSDKAGSLSIDDRYYANSRCLTIYDRVYYVEDVAFKPYNLALTGEYFIDYAGGTLDYDYFYGTANSNGYVLSLGTQSDALKTVYTIRIDHHLNCVNMVVSYTTVSLTTEFLIN